MDHASDGGSYEKPAIVAASVASDQSRSGLYQCGPFALDEVKMNVQRNREIVWIPGHVEGRMPGNPLQGGVTREMTRKTLLVLAVECRNGVPDPGKTGAV